MTFVTCKLARITYHPKVCHFVCTRFDTINSAACIVADLHAILFEPNGNIYK